MTFRNIYFSSFVFLGFFFLSSWKIDSNDITSKVQFNTSNVLPEDSTDISSDCFFNGTLMPEERRSISLFKNAKKIKIVSFSQRITRSTPIDGTKIGSKYLKEEITLTEVQINELTNVLYNYNYSKYRSIFGGSRGSCYEPRHAIIFLNSTDKVLGYFEFCFSCLGHKTLPLDENAGVFCEGKYQLIKKFFQSAGITFFNEGDDED